MTRFAILRAPRPRRGNRRGFTLIESMVALVVLVFGVMMVAALTGVIMKANRNSVNRTRADEVLNQKIESFQSIAYENIFDGTDTVTVGDVRFTRSWTVSPNTPVANVMQIRLTARWVEGGDTLRVSTTTLRGTT